MNRVAEVERQTRETHIRLRLAVDEGGECSVATGVGFFDHMLQAWAVHGGFTLEIHAEGDLEVDGHHLVEDVGICLGQAIARLWDTGEGCARFGSAVVPMDDALVACHLDISGRSYLRFALALPVREFQGFHTDLLEEFLRALVNHAGLTLHVTSESGSNAHHMVEACFKALGRALAQALQREGCAIRSTKGRLREGEMV